MRKPISFRSFLNRKTALVVGAGAAVVALSGTAAFAYWTTTGSGSGSASTGTSHAVSVAQVGTISALTPGSPAQAVDFTITNPDSTNQYISTVVVSISSVVKAVGAPAGPCSASDFDLVQPTASYGDLTPGAHPYSPSGATLALKNLATNQDGCKGATVNLAFNAS